MNIVKTTQIIPDQVCDDLWDAKDLETYLGITDSDDDELTILLVEDQSGNRYILIYKDDFEDWYGYIDE